MAKQRSLQSKVAQLQAHFDGDAANEIETGDWSPDNIAKNRAAINKELNPWVQYGMTCSEWYEQIIKPKSEAQAA